MPKYTMNALAKTTQEKLSVLKNSSLASIVQQEVERCILAGEFEPGGRLNEAELAQRLGVSRGPVREALRSLEEAGLVSNEKNRGVFVRVIPLDEAIEIFDLRAAMDELAGRQLAATITPPQIRELHDLVDSMAQAVAAVDAHAYYLLNLSFHERLVAMAGNRKLNDIYRRLVNELALFRRLNLADGGHIPVSANEHEQIVDAIVAGDVARAGKAMFDHVMESKARTIAKDLKRRGVAPNEIAALAKVALRSELRLAPSASRTLRAAKPAPPSKPGKKSAKAAAKPKPPGKKAVPKAVQKSAVKSAVKTTVKTAEKAAKRTAEKPSPKPAAKQAKAARTS